MDRRPRIDDIILGSIGAHTPPSDTLDHALRYFSTWSGTDKLMMASSLQQASQQTIMFPDFAIHVGKHKQLLDPDGLYKFASQLSIARRIMGFWGLLAIFKGLSRLERSPPESRFVLNIQRLQGLSMLVFYPLEYISFFSSPFVPLLRISPATSAKAGIWSVRAWGIWVVLRIVELLDEWSRLGRKEHQMDEDTFKAAMKRKRAIVFQLVTNISRLPVILHWSVVGGIYKNEVWTSGLSLLSGMAAFWGGWEGIPVPSR
ncbi:hypothetical protein FB45DRAFT_1032339 [Roridomyces roridus]|uniref:Peroxisomal biogenesis factor 11 n=1 Tax=Roridomyces roridus TaxID=1738132 RepID=A0AAD7FHW9_9AGAR|nr:hypothetical protein FB45DRAFT_1032339 [Roridomyces roridus]